LRPDFPQTKPIWQLVYKIFNKINKNKNSQSKNKKSTKKGVRTVSRKQVNLVKSMFQPAYKPISMVKPQPKASATVSLSKCAARLALSIADPFNPAARDVCLPTSPAIDSATVALITRTDLTVGLLGLGWIQVSPCLASDGAVAYITGATFNSSNFEVLTANSTYVTGVSAIAPAQAPYTTANLSSNYTDQSPSVAGRIVSVGVRITYSGTTLNQSGMVYCYADPSHNASDAFGASVGTIALMSTFETCDVSAVSRDPCTLVTTVTNPNEYAYTSYVGGTTTEALAAVYPYSVNTSVFFGGFTNTVASLIVGVPVMCIAISGATAGITFHVDIIQHVEYTGYMAAALVKPREADVEGTASVLAAAFKLPLYVMSNPGVSRWNLMMQALKAGAKMLKPIVMPMLESSLAALLV
jgi:hypothetical protein